MGKEDYGPAKLRFGQNLGRCPEDLGPKTPAGPLDFEAVIRKGVADIPQISHRIPIRREVSCKLRGLEPRSKRGHSLVDRRIYIEGGSC